MKNNNFKKKCMILVLSLFVFGMLIFIFVSATPISEDLHLNIQTTNATGSVVTGTFEFVFNISTSSNCSDTSKVIYNNSINLTTDSRGIISYYLENVNLTFSEQYWLCYYRNGTLINASKIARIPYTFRARNISLSGVEVDSNFNLNGFNLTVDNADFNGGWQNNGLSIINGDIYAQTGYFYNITSLNVTRQNLTILEDFYALGNVGIGTTSPGSILHVYENNANDETSGLTLEQDGSGSMAIRYVRTGSQTWSIGLDSTGNDFSISATDDLSSDYKVRIKPTIVGEIGMGSPLTGTKVHISNPGTTFDNYFAINNGNTFVVQTGGNVGIGTASPDEKLTVVGNLNITGNITQRGAPILPLGTILMYDGTGIANVSARTADIGDESGDTISMPGWKVCNGNAGTPNILNKFIRSETTSGTTGGSDDAIVVSHNHAFTGSAMSNHGHTDNFAFSGNALPTHRHYVTIYKSTVGMEGGGGFTTYMQQYGTQNNYANYESAGTPTGTITGGVTAASAGTPSGTISTEGSSDGIGANKPAYYSLIFIKKIS